MEDPPGGRRPRPAPRIPAGLANQVDFAAPAAPAAAVPLPGHPAAPPHHLTPTSAVPPQPAAVPAGGPTASALSGQPSLRPTAAPPTSAAAPVAAEGGLQLRGPLMTFHAQKGWEVVGEMRSVDWPADVPVPGCACLCS